MSEKQLAHKYWVGLFAIVYVLMFSCSIFGEGFQSAKDKISLENKTNRTAAIIKKGLAKVLAEDKDNFPQELNSTPNRSGEKQVVYDTWKNNILRKRGMGFASLKPTALVPTPSVPMVSKTSTINVFAEVATSSPVVLPVTKSTKMSLSSVGSVSLFDVDITPPTIGVLQINDKTVISGDTIPSLPLIKSVVNDETELGDWRINVVDNQNSILFTRNGTLSGTSGTVSANVTPALSAGTYKIVVVIKDSSGNTNTKNITSLKIESGLKISSLVNAPNPFNPINTVTKLQYQLSQSADVALSIYSISGEKLWSQDYAAGSNGGTAGFNSVIWDGRQFGQVLANGPYIAYIVAKNGSEKSVGKIKILILK